MIIQVERLWLYEAIITDPFIFEKTDGVDITMSDNILDTDRVIELLDIDTAVFFINTVLKGGLSVTAGYGGEDHNPLVNTGKVSAAFEVEFNLPIGRSIITEQLLGKEFSVVGMRRDLTLFAFFARFTIKNVSIDNDVLQRVSLTSKMGAHPIYEVNNLNVDIIINVIGENPPIFPPFIETEGFDYVIESAMN